MVFYSKKKLYPSTASSNFVWPSALDVMKCSISA